MGEHPKPPLSTGPDPETLRYVLGGPIIELIECYGMHQWAAGRYAAETGGEAQRKRTIAAAGLKRCLSDLHVALATLAPTPKDETP